MTTLFLTSIIMPISLPYEQLTARAFALIDAGDSLEGVYELYNAWLAGSYQASLIFNEDLSINKGQFRLMAHNIPQDNNDDETLFKLGLCHLTGIGIPQSYPEAETIFSRLSTKGISRAKVALGEMYENNRAGLELSQALRDARAVALYTQASLAGDTTATNNLASMYVTNRAGLELSQAQRDTKAVELFTKASLAGDAAATTGCMKIIALD